MQGSIQGGRQEGEGRIRGAGGPPRPYRPWPWVAILVAAAILGSPERLGAVLTEDGGIGNQGVRLGLQALRLGLAAAALLAAVGRVRPRFARAAGAGALLVGALSAWGFARSPEEAWKRPGLAMEDRLRAIARDHPRLERPSEEELAGSVDLRAERVGLAKAIQERAKLAQRLLELGECESAAEEIEAVLARLDRLDPRVRRQHEKGLLRILVAAYLRWGEVQNCLANHNADSCLLPIRGGGVHADPSASKAAIEILRGALERDPDDLVWRWLLNLACMTVGEYPDGVEERWRIPPEVFASDAPFPRFPDVAPALGIAVDRLSGGCVLEDFDLDGDLDLMASSMGLFDPLAYFVNEADGSFRDRSAEAGLLGELGGLNLCHADYDNDGYPDVFVLRGAWMDHHGRFPNSLLRNREGERFEDVTEAAGVLSFYPTQVGAWADYDLDGFLDLFVGNESRSAQGHPSELYHNSGDGTFEDRIAGSGIRLESFVKGAAWGDYDEDGDPDLFVSRRHDPSSLYRNDTAEGRRVFEDVTHAAGVASDLESFPCWFFDYDQDGHLDLFVAGYSTAFLDDETDRLEDIPAARLGLPLTTDGYPHLFRNRGDGTFEDMAGPAGLRRVVSVMGANFGDVDNDGWPDLYLGTGSPDFLALMANRMFHNDRGRRFQDVTTAGGFGHLQKGHGIAFGDIDLDGDQDVYAVLGGWYPADNFPNALFLNPGNANAWVTLKLEGTRSNRSAIGARVTLRIATPRGPRNLYRVCGTGGSFGSSSLWLETGLGDATALLEVEVRWPGGERQVFRNLPLRRILRLREGDPEPHPESHPPIPIESHPHAAHHHAG